MQPGENGEQERKNAANFPVLPGNAGKKTRPLPPKIFDINYLEIYGMPP
jgi:hypothetical protein